MKLKHLYSLLLLAPLALGFTACDDDDDKIPDVNIQATIEGATVQDGTIYVVSGQDFTITSLEMVNHTGKAGNIGAVTYFWNGIAVAECPQPPYDVVFPTSTVQPGTYLLQAQMPIYVVDYPICYGVFSYKVVVVASEADLPAPPATATLPGSVQPKIDK